MASLYSIIALLAMAASTSAAGARLISCTGVTNGDGYNVNLMYGSVQEGSRSSICGSFSKEFQSRCNNAPVNCATDKDGLLSLGVKVKKNRDFNCVTTAFEEALQADIDTDANARCSDIPLRSVSRRSRIMPRQPPGAGPIAETLPPQLGDFIDITSGQRLFVRGFIPDGEFANLQRFSISSALPGMANKLSALGRSIGGVETQDLSDLTGPFAWKATFDTGLARLGLNIQQKDWRAILGSMAALAKRENRRKVSLVLATAGTATAATGTVAATVSFIFFA
ncbi:MAG: hypothetical protein M1813_002240 [Trichoglossum hirsutum]|nr:MAG: hypothetical protein M1813_002240 [Trichoglossum hirsutum]